MKPASKPKSSPQKEGEKGDPPSTAAAPSKPKRAMATPQGAPEMKWWSAIALILPMVLSERAMAPTGPLRFALFAVFLIAFITYFILIRARTLEMPRHSSNRVLGIGMGALVAVFLASGAVAINKQEAVYTTAHLFLFTLAAALFARTVAREQHALPLLCRTLTIALIVHSSVAILQYYGLGFTELPPKSDIPYGLMANRNLLGSGLAFLLPFAAYSIYAGGRSWRIIGGTSIWLGVYGIILAQTRGAWLALAAAVVLANLSIWGLRKQFGTAFVVGWGKSIGIFLIGTTFAVFISLAIDGDRGLAASLKERAKTLGEPVMGKIHDTSFRARLHLYRESIDLMRDHPLLGVGPGNWRVAAPNYNRPGTLNDTGITIRDRAHNIYLQIGAETGIPGLLIYLFLWCCALGIAVQSILAATDNRQRLLLTLALAGLVLYAVDGLVSFPNEFIGDLVMLAFLIGIPLGLVERAQSSPSAVIPARLIPKPLMAILLLPLCCCVWMGYAHENFEYHVKMANAYNKLGRYQEALAEVDAGLSRWVTISPLGDPIEYFAGHAYAELGDLNRALAQIQRAHQLNPWSIRVWNELGIVYVKMNRLDEGIACYREALRMAPKFDVALRNLGTACYSKQMFKEAAAALAQRNQDDPYLIMLLAHSYRQLEQYDKAIETLRAGLARFPNDAGQLELAGYLEYDKTKDYPAARDHFARLLQLQPNHPKKDEYLSVIAYADRNIPPAPAPKPDMAK